MSIHCCLGEERLQRSWTAWWSHQSRSRSICHTPCMLKWSVKVTNNGNLSPSPAHSTLCGFCSLAELRWGWISCSFLSHKNFQHIPVTVGFPWSTVRSTNLDYGFGYGVPCGFVCGLESSSFKWVSGVHASLSIYRFVFLSTYLPIYLSVGLPRYVSLCLSSSFERWIYLCMVWVSVRSLFMFFCEFVLCICVYAYVWTGPDLIYLEYTNVDRV